MGASITTSSSTNNLAYGDIGAAGPAVTLLTATTVLVSLSSTLQSSAGSDYAEMSFAVSGSTTIAAADINGAIYATTPSVGVDMRLGGTFFLSGLTPGSNTFTAKYKAVSGGVATFANRHIAVQPLTT